MTKQFVGSAASGHAQPSPSRDDKQAGPKAAGADRKPEAKRPTDEAPEPGTDPWNEGP